MRSLLLLGSLVLIGDPCAVRSDEPLPPTAMPRDHKGPRPKPRTLAEVNAVLAGAPSPAEKVRPIRLVLVAGEKSHGKGGRGFPSRQKTWSPLFKPAPTAREAAAC